MDAFEQLVAELFFAEGYWVETSVKVELTKEEKREIGRFSSPRWEIDLVAYRPESNELLAIECKSFLDSTGVTWAELQDGHRSKRYKMFREPVLRDVVLGRLKRQMVDAGRCPPDVSVGLAMVAGKVKSGAHDAIAAHFAARGWRFFGPDWLRERLNEVAKRGYSNQISAIVAKLLLRADGTAKAVVRPDEIPLRCNRPDNPKREGSAAHQRFEAYFLPQVTTVEAALRHGVRRDDIRNDVARGYITLG